ncbi:MAG: methionyl-tRNA formyltransferase [Clostridia bacterium]|nr:methionyl-tRNA formyltransferase [Clostridia bacterium]
MRIGFMGTPDFARAHLEALINAGHEVMFVLCRADKPVGRKKILTAPPVKECALEHNIPVYQPESLKDGAIKDVLDKYKPELIVVVAYGRILPEYVLNYPEYGCINVHGSLLPKYRGASPVQSAIIDGETETGITVMYMDKGLDTGDMILKKKCAIDIKDNQITLFDKLEKLGMEGLLETVELIEKGEVQREAQNENDSNYASVLTSKTGHIDWEKDALTVHNLVRGTYPWPAAYSYFEGAKYKITETELSDKRGKPGEVLVSSPKEGLVVAAGNGAIKILRLQAEGGKEMNAADYLRGHSFEIGKTFDKYTEEV